MIRYARLLAMTLIINISLSFQASFATGSSFTEKTNSVLATLTPKLRYQNTSNQQLAYLDKANIRIENCQQYPYHETYLQTNKVGFEILLEDIKNGLEKGLQCLAGNSPMGKLHPYHATQALRLMKLLESDRIKTFRCVQDETFAYAVAKSAPDHHNDGHINNYSDDITKSISFPGVIIDTYRIGGFISKKFNAETYRDFFKLNDEQIREISTGKPVQLDSMHRYKNRSSLMFHEMVHWLGHEHSSIHPDVTDLYDTCCFGGSDHINDAKLNAKYQQQACNILKDKELWEANSYKKIQLWHDKEYDQFKRTMRNSYD